MEGFISLLCLAGGCLLIYYRIKKQKKAAKEYQEKLFTDITEKGNLVKLLAKIVFGGTLDPLELQIVGKKDFEERVWGKKLSIWENAKNKQLQLDTYEKEVFAYCNPESLKQEAINTLGLDESELIEIRPVCAYSFAIDLDAIASILDAETINSDKLISLSRQIAKSEANKRYGFQVLNDKCYSSKYQVTWIFSTQKQLCVYEKVFDFYTGEMETTTHNYLWKHITKVGISKQSIKGTAQHSYFIEIQNISSDMYSCAVQNDDNTKQSINAISRHLATFV
jgi:hypothetical protein